MNSIGEEKEGKKMSFDEEGNLTRGQTLSSSCSSMHRCEQMFVEGREGNKI